MTDSNADAIKEAKRAYHREWRRKNPERIAKIQERYWERKAAEIRTRAANQEPEQRSGCATE